VLPDALLELLYDDLGLACLSGRRRSRCGRGHTRCFHRMRTRGSNTSIPRRIPVVRDEFRNAVAVDVSAECRRCDRELASWSVLRPCSFHRGEEVRATRRTCMRGTGTTGRRAAARGRIVCCRERQGSSAGAAPIAPVEKHDSPGQRQQRLLAGAGPATHSADAAESGRRAVSIDGPSRSGS